VVDVYARSFGEVFSVTSVEEEDGAEEAVGVVVVSVVLAAAGSEDSVVGSVEEEVLVVEAQEEVGDHQSYRIDWTYRTYNRLRRKW
jgi:hypothetical protein